MYYILEKGNITFFEECDWLRAIPFFHEYKLYIVQANLISYIHLFIQYSNKLCMYL